MWQPEFIPDKDMLYFRVHKYWYRGGTFNTAVFADREGQGGMSVDWSNYCPTPQRCQDGGKTPQDNGVVSFNCGEVRKIPPPLVVEHKPIYNPPDERNRAHSEVLGEKDEEVRVKLGRIMHWEIDVPQPWYT
jgi:hypothetical protein